MRQEVIAVNTTDHRMAVMYIISYYGRINSKKKKDEEGGGGGGEECEEEEENEEEVNETSPHET